MSNDWVVHVGDCLQILPTLAAGSVDAVVTDPPYGMKLNTDSTRFSRNNPEQQRREKAAGLNVGRDDWGDVIGDDKPFDPSPWVGFPRVVIFGYQFFAARVPLGTTLVWVKRSDELFGSFLSDAELAWMKGGHGVYCFRKQFPPPARMHEAQSSACVHPCQKPVELMMWAIQKLKVPAGGLVFDPYCGSGSTGVACRRLGLRFIGCELDPHYAAIARRRIAEAGFPLLEAANA